VMLGGAIVVVQAWRRLPTYIAATGVIGLGGSGLMNLTSDGWFWTYIRKIHSAHDFNYDRFWASFGNILWHFRALTIVVIVIITRFLLKMSALLFEGVEAGRIAIPGVYPETAQPTRHLVAAGLWVFALAISYPYLPGSSSDAFKGVSVFVGLMISLGSTGLVNQAMGGLTVRYSRALRLGDFVRIGDVEGTVAHIGALSTKLKTPRREEVTIPHAVVVSQMTTNFSRHAEVEGVLTPTSVTIGYDAPWRQVHAMLLQAAARTPGIRPTPPPIVLQTALDDFYVQYTLSVCLQHPHLRVVTLGALHANIQDVFNEHGVQIMSPHYETDPEARKVVPKAQWYPAPAAAPAEDTQPSWAVR